MKGYYQKVPSTKKTFPNPKATQQYEQSIGPVKPTVVDRIKETVGAVSNSRIVGKVRERGREIAEENNRPSPRRAGPSRISSSAGITDAGMGNMGGMMMSNPFGVGQPGNPFAPTRSPFRERAPPALPKPKRRKRRKARVAGDDGRYDPPTGIPSHMKWMFGQ